MAAEFKSDDDFHCTDIEAIPKIVSELRSGYNSNIMKDVWKRKQILACFVRMLHENKTDIIDAMTRDFKNLTESEYELSAVISAAVQAIDNLDCWAKPQSVHKSWIVNTLDSVYIAKEPFGLILSMAPWNYPISLLLEPAVGALAAGNCVLLKPSELARHTAMIIHDLVHKYFEPNIIQVVNGGVKETTELLKQRFDYIFFTGSPFVGKIVMAAAAKFLTPVTLELGGKSPCIVSRHCGDLQTVANRLMFGKCFNGGQTCIAPDYALVDSAIKDELLELCASYLKNAYPNDIEQSKDFCKAASKAQFNRLKKILDTSKGHVFYGGNSNEADKFISPTILSGVEPSDSSMQEEIFGPILPIMLYDDIEEAIKYIKEHEKPLSLYVFSNNRREIRNVLDNTSSGGVTVNDTLLHATIDSLPFGGVGSSGMGGYHGKKTFDTFSHFKSILHKASGGEFLNTILRYPPYKPERANFLLKLMFGSIPKRVLNPNYKWKTDWMRKYFYGSSILVIGALIAIAVYFILNSTT